MQEPANDLTIRRFLEDDRSAVASLYSRIFGEEAMEALERRWDWQFHGNPTCDTAEPIMWVAELEDGLVGFLASFCARFKLFDDEVIIRLPCDLMVSSKARGRGVGEKLIRTYIASEELIANGLGYSPPAGRMYHRLGYQAVDAEPLMMRPLDMRRIVGDVLHRGRRPERTPGALIRWTAGLLGGGLNVGLGVVNAVRRPRSVQRFAIRPCAEPDDAFDALWRRLSSFFPIAAVRDRRWVQWRFVDDPSFEHSLLCAFDSRGELVGYVDVRISSRRGLRFGRILDLFCDPGESDLIEALVAAGINHLKADGVDLITCLGHLPGIRNVISKYCYVRPRRLQRPAMFLWRGDTGLTESIHDADLWHLTHADGDDGFSP